MPEGDIEGARRRAEHENGVQSHGYTGSTIRAKRHDIGTRFFFSDELVVNGIDGKTQENGGLPTSEKERRAGTHSGSSTTLRYLDGTNVYLPGAAILLHVEATYKLNAVEGKLPPGLQEGQITTQGLLVLGNDGVTPVGDRRYAITGGTDAYANARGHVTESVDGRLKTLEIIV